MTRHTTTFAALMLAAVLTQGGTVRADDWDVASSNDDSLFSDNALFHGSEQVHDLHATGPSNDQDWYRVEAGAWSSYQVVVDGMTGDVRLGATGLQLVDQNGAAQATSTLTDFGGSLSLAWAHLSFPPAAAEVQWVRIRGAACGPSCTTEDRYRVRFYDTTYTIPRFNNTGSQSTVLIVQNVTDRACRIDYEFLGPDGQAITARTSELPARGLDVVATAPFLPNAAGSVRIAHTCGYGGLSGKAVSIEPATGFTFDTQMVARPH